MNVVRHCCHVSLNVVTTASRYYKGICYFMWCTKGYGEYDDFKEDSAKKLHMYSLALTLRIWNLPHYRAKTFGVDVRNNLVNIAVPGTGVPLSAFCYQKLWFALFVFILNPIVSFLSAMFLACTYGCSVTDTFPELLLEPKHWFALWRLNSLLVAHHEQVTQSPSYVMEDKGRFLKDGEAKGIPVSPVLNIRSIVAKHAKIEGGMAIHFFKNFLHNGDWILQPALQNSAFIAELLPANAPLSTLRIITASSLGLPGQQPAVARSGVPSSSGAKDDNTHLTSHKSTTAGEDPKLADLTGSIEVVTVVFRAGREGAATDHVSVCFDVCRKSGVIQAGTSNQHWYQLGPKAILGLTADWNTQYTVHPDTNKVVAGRQIPGFPQIVELVKQAHVAMVPDVPLVGWDVALTDSGVYLLELNISCNFFNGSYDRQWYVDFMGKHFAALSMSPAQADKQKQL